MRFPGRFLKGTFLKGKVAKRIALILFLAALVPTALITFMTHRAIESLVVENAHKKLVDSSHSYGMAAFSNLMYARTSLIQLATLLQQSDLAQLEKLNQLNQTMFLSLHVLDAKGELLDNVRHAGAKLNIQQIQTPVWVKLQQQLQPELAKLQVFPAVSNSPYPVVALVYPWFRNGVLDRLLVAEVSPDFIWGVVNDYPSDIRLCVYRLNIVQREPLFCSAQALLPVQTRSQKENRGEWELFLRAEFLDVPWVFQTERQYLVASSRLGNFIGSYGYIGAALVSLLLVALLSLIQVRRTMGPLAQLIEGTRKVSQGKFAQVAVDGTSEFAELAESFNHMSSDIQKQMETLQSFSAIDQEMATKLDVEALIQKVIERVQALMPDTLVSVAKLMETTEDATHCVLFHSSNYPDPQPRVTLTTQQVSLIKSYTHGCFLSCASPHECMVNCQCELRDFLKSADTHYCWILPIFWQRELCAFLIVGSDQPMQADSPYWKEISELAGRIGIAISAQAREDQLLIQAQYDSLTGLPNRILLQDRLKQAVDHSTRTGDVFWLVFLDLDRFKVINDSLGHNAGDVLLVEVASRLKGAVRDTDTVARFGGDEFIIILQGNMDESLRMTVLRRLMQTVQTPVKLSASEVVVTCSVGVAVYPTDALNTEALLRNADIAMYRAKEAGKNNFQFFTQEMNDKVADRLRLETHLRKAIEQNEFELHYQPKVSLATGRIVGLEALIRWRSPVLGFIGPQHFITLAEETGLIVPIGEWALRQACRQAKSWQDAGYQPLQMAVNLSVRQFNQKELVQSIRQVLQETQLESQYLELELTESVIIQEVEAVVQHLTEIKKLGIKLSIDDFGTGYSSLSYLQRLPLDALKIDKSFVDAIVTRQDAAPIVASIIALAKNLHFKVIAEGVETPEQLAYLVQHGCDEMQGYYFSRPVTAEQIEEMFRLDKVLAH